MEDSSSHFEGTEHQRGFSSAACRVCVCCLVVLRAQARYKSKARDMLRSGCNELHRPDILTALFSTTMGSKVNKQLQRVLNHPLTRPQTSRLFLKKKISTSTVALKKTKRKENWQTFTTSAVCGQTFIQSLAHLIATRLHPNRQMNWRIQSYISSCPFDLFHVPKSPNVSLITKTFNLPNAVPELL